MRPIAAFALGLLGIISHSVFAKVLLYQPTGPYHVAQTQHVFNHTTPDDITAPPGTDEGTILLVTIYYPTPSPPPANQTLPPYVDPTNAAIFDAALGLPPNASISSIVTTLQHDAPFLSGPGFSPGSSPHPSILFLPGAGMPCFAYTAYLSQLASLGHAVFALDHPGEPPHLPLPDGSAVASRFPPFHAFSWAQYQRIFAHRVADAAALLAPPLLPALARSRNAPFDLSAVAVFGHSIGGAGAAGLLAKSDPPLPEIRAGANLDGWYYFDMRDLQFDNGTGGETYPDLAPRPFLEISGETTPRTWRNFGSAQGGWLRDFAVRGAEHFDFSDLPLIVDGLGQRGGAAGGLLGTVAGERLMVVVMGFLERFFGALAGTGGCLGRVDKWQRCTKGETEVRERKDGVVRYGVGEGLFAGGGGEVGEVEVPI